MRVHPYELQLPLDDGAAGALARLRVDHLKIVSGAESAVLVRLARAFPSLRAIYTASEAELARVVGPVAAARVRWFLDAPIDTRLAVETATLPPQTLITSENSKPRAAPGTSMRTAA
jgi:hypothetical protein